MVRHAARLRSPPTMFSTTRKSTYALDTFFRGLIVFGLILLYCISTTAASGLIKGKIQPCVNEGEVIKLHSSLEGPCTTCRCTRGTVICEVRCPSRVAFSEPCREHCPNTETCHLVLMGERLRADSCCEKCKGCQTTEGRYRDGEQWHDPREPCTLNRCITGVVTKTKIKCHTPCNKPLPLVEGECCPRCPDQCPTSSNPVHPTNSSAPPSPSSSTTSPTSPSASAAESDPCVSCECGDDGSRSCTTEVCPVLSCSSSEVVHPTGHCCPRCSSKPRRIPSDTPGCYMGRQLYPSGTNFTLNPCTSCTCQGSTPVCHRQSCPSLDCPRHLQIHKRGQCCPVCRPPERVKRVCRSPHRRREYKDGETWKMNKCTKCSCTDGEISCEMERCPAEEPVCPARSRPAKVPGQCCKQCVEDDAVCTVFGDPHYNSFDGKMFNFQGTCKYLLAKDCGNRTFSVRVNNHPRKSRLFSWTRSATIKVGSLRIALRQKKEVKVNHEVVQLPYIRLGQVTILQDPSDNFNVLVKLTAAGGVSVLWDGDSFLQVRVPPSFKNRMCGLCGNYNNNRTDDFRTRRGRIATLTKRFANSWTVGGRSQCSSIPYRKRKSRRRGRHRHRRPPKPRPPCADDRAARLHAVKQCNRLKTGPFTACHAQVHPSSYFKSCMQDMCECGDDKTCYCEALTAYSHACRRRDVTVDWLPGTDCADKQNCVDRDDCPSR